MTTDKLNYLEDYLKDMVASLSKKDLSQFGQGRLAAFKTILAELQEPEEDEERQESDVDYYSFIPQKHR